MNSISIPSSLTSKLEQIKQYMSKGRVTAFVGAGFSLNAEMPSHVQMKTWAQLRVDFLTNFMAMMRRLKARTKMMWYSCNDVYLGYERGIEEAMDLKGK